MRDSFCPCVQLDSYLGRLPSQILDKHSSVSRSCSTEAVKSHTRARSPRDLHVGADRLTRGTEKNGRHGSISLLWPTLDIREDLPADAEGHLLTTRLRAGGKTEHVHIGRPSILIASWDHARLIVPIHVLASWSLLGAKTFCWASAEYIFHRRPLAGAQQQFSPACNWQPFYYSLGNDKQHRKLPGPNSERESKDPVYREKIFPHMFRNP